MDRCTGLRGITEILLKTALNAIQSNIFNRHFFRNRSPVLITALSVSKMLLLLLVEHTSNPFAEQSFGPFIYDPINRASETLQEKDKILQFVQDRQKKKGKSLSEAICPFSSTIPIFSVKNLIFFLSWFNNNNNKFFIFRR